MLELKTADFIYFILLSYFYFYFYLFSYWELRVNASVIVMVTQSCDFLYQQFITQSAMAVCAYRRNYQYPNLFM